MVNFLCKSEKFCITPISLWSMLCGDLSVFIFWWVSLFPLRCLCYISGLYEDHGIRVAKVLLSLSSNQHIISLRSSQFTCVKGSQSGAASFAMLLTTSSVKHVGWRYQIHTISRFVNSSGFFTTITPPGLLSKQDISEYHIHVWHFKKQISLEQTWNFFTRCILSHTYSVGCLGSLWVSPWLTPPPCLSSWDFRVMLAIKAIFGCMCS